MLNALSASGMMQTRVTMDQDCKAYGLFIAQRSISHMNKQIKLSGQRRLCNF